MVLGALVVLKHSLLVVALLEVKVARILDFVQHGFKTFGLSDKNEQKNYLHPKKKT